MRKSLVLVMFVLVMGMLSVASAENFPFLKGFNITEDGDYPLAVSADPNKKTAAQLAVLEAKRLGANHIVINPRALMVGPFSNELIPVKTPGESNRDMTIRLTAFLKWVKTQNLTTQIRPIFFVVKDVQSMAVYTTEINGVKKIWWHGNIQPKDPNAWFDSFKAYQDMYLLVAKMAKVDFYTLGAELYSMTVGIEDMWKEFPHGFPKYWNQLLEYARTKLPPTTKIMYDANFTDDTANSDGLNASGGEVERWRYRLVDLATTEPRNAKNESWYELKKFWTSLDAIGIDMYRSFAAKSDVIPTKYDELVKMLRLRSDRYSNQLDTTLMEIELALDVKKPLVFKELGFRSAEGGFVNPFAYDNTIDKVNVAHQAAAYQAFFESFFGKGLEWFKGVVFWDIGVNPTRQGPNDSGFTPLGKKQTEDLIKKYFAETP